MCIGKYGRECIRLIVLLVNLSLSELRLAIAVFIPRNLILILDQILECKYNDNGRFPCCNSKAVRFNTSIHKTGCTAKNHIIS
jgi:hypothetical protein